MRDEAIRRLLRLAADDDRLAPSPVGDRQLVERCVAQPQDDPAAKGIRRALSSLGRAVHKLARSGRPKR